MKTAIFDRNGKKIAGDSEVVLPEHIVNGTLPKTENGIYYSLLSDGNVSVIYASDELIRGFGNNFDEAKRMTKYDFIGNLLFGKAGTDIKSICAKYSFPYDEVRRVFVAEITDDVSQYVSDIEEIFQNEDAAVYGIDRHKLAIICAERDIDDPSELADAISATFSELNTDCNIGVSCICDNASGICDAFGQAMSAIKTGKRFSYGGGVWMYSNILPELIISDMPQAELYELKRKAEKICNGLDAETVELAKEFFRHNLNISETARYCYLHRNTLIYRLDRIQKETGLNLRNFDEAVALRIYIAANTILK